MSDEKEKDQAQQESPTNATGGGQQPAGDAGKVKEQSEGSTPDPRFTNEQVESIVEQRLARERRKYADYDQLKEKAERWAEFEESQKSELAKLRPGLEVR